MTHFLLAGLVPGVLYGLDDDRNVLKAMVTIDQKTLLQEIKKRGRSFENTVYHAEVRDENDQTIMKYPVTPCQTQFCARKFSVILLLVSEELTKYLTSDGEAISSEFSEAFTN